MNMGTSTGRKRRTVLTSVTPEPLSSLCFYVSTIWHLEIGVPAFIFDFVGAALVIRQRVPWLLGRAVGRGRSSAVTRIFYFHCFFYRVSTK